MSTPGDNRPYDALALPSEALTDGGVEILRAGIINEELYVMARRAFKDPARWGEVLADIARRIALYQSAEDTDLTEQEILTQIEQAFAADLGASEVDEGESAPTKRTAKRAASAKFAKKATKPAKTKSRAPAKTASAKSRPNSTKRKKR